MKVYVENHEEEYESMFEEQGWLVTREIFKAHAVCFVGGADVTPSMYMEQNTHSGNSETIDCASVGLWVQARSNNLLNVGICRGGQFLNVMEGGKMYQHIDGHGLWGTHPLEYEGQTYNVTSTHHQEMIPHISCENYYRAPDGVVEAVIYDKSFCFQPHPEYSGADETRKLFFKMLEDYNAIG